MTPTKSKRLYRTLVADPPWRYTQAASNNRAQPTYETMTLGQMVELPVHEFAEDDAHLWLWTTNAMMEHAHRLARAWGFVPFNIVTWCKPGPGVGHYVRTNTEHVLLCSRGRPQVPEHKAMASWFQWPRTRHSEKPDAFYDLVEQVSPTPRLELFARRKRLGWDAWGNEIDSDVEVARDALKGGTPERALAAEAEVERLKGALVIVADELSHGEGPDVAEAFARRAVGGK